MAKLSTTIPGLGPSRAGRSLGGVSIPGLTPRKKGTRDDRRLPRIGIDELNKRGIQAVRDAGVPFKPSDRRSAFEKTLDWIDVPRSFVAQGIARVAGMTSKDIAKLKDRGTFGKQIWTSDILQHLGVKNKVVRAVLGFVGDVAIDPLTYLLSGATTGRRIIAGAPKVTKPGLNVLSRTNKAIVAGRVVDISDDVVRATGLSAERLAVLGKFAAKQSAKRGKGTRDAIKRIKKLVNKRMTSRLRGNSLLAKQATRDFFVKFGVKGQTILRVPFAATGVTRKTGRAARLFQEFATPVIGSVTGLGTKGAAATAAQQAVIQGARQVATSKAFQLGKQGQAAQQTIAQQKLAAQFQVRVLLNQRLGAASKAKAAATRLRQLVTGGRGRGARVGLTPTQRVEARRLLAVIKGTGVSSQEVRLLEQAELGVGGREILSQLRAVEANADSLTRAASIATAQAVEGGGLFDAAGLKRTPFLQKELAEISRKIRAGAFESPKARIAAEAAIKKELRSALAESAKTARGVPGKLAKQQRAVGKTIEEFSIELNRIKFDPDAAQSIKELTRGKFGVLRSTQPDASKGALGELARKLGRQKDEFFGAGHSKLGTVAAGVKQDLGAGATAAEMFRALEVTQGIAPQITAIAKKTGLADDVLHARLWDFVDTAALKLAPDSPVRARMAETLRLIQQLPDEAKKVIGALNEFGQTRRATIEAFRAKDVAPRGAIESARRLVSPTFKAQSDPLTARTFVDVTRSAKRTKELRRVHADGTIQKAYTSLDDASIKRANALRGLPDDQWGKLQTYDIAGFEINNNPDLFKSLLPSDAPAGITQFATSIPGAAAAEAGDKVRRLAAGRFRDFIQGTGVPAQRVAENPDLFRGFAQMRFDFAGTPPLFEQVFKPLQGMAFPQQVIDHIGHLMALSKQPKEIRRLLRISDNIFGVWKGITLLHPAYTLRNIVQNVVGNAMAGTKMLPFLRQSVPGSPVDRIVNNAIKGRAQTGFISISGKTHSAQSFADLLRTHNVIGSGRLSQIPNIATSTQGFFKSLPGGMFKWWFTVNNRAESTMKAAGLWSALDEGLDLTTALQRMARAMPDLTDLTLFERSVAKRVFPWYSWMRKNGALQLFHYLPQKPAFANAPVKVQKAWEEAFSGDDVVPDELRPEWQREQQAVQVAGDNTKGTVFLSASWLPFQELVKLGAGLGDARSGATSVLESTRPGIRFFAEAATGRDIFRREEVDPLTPSNVATSIPSALIGKSRTPLDTLLAVRPLREAFRVADVGGEAGVGAAASRAVLGGAFQPIDAQKGLRNIDVRSQRAMATLRSKINTAIQKNDLKEVRNLLLKWTQLLRERQRLGLNVARASEEAFGAAGLTPEPEFAGAR